MLKHIPKEWLLLIIIAALILVIGILDWSKKPNTTNNTLPTSNQSSTVIEKEEANVTVKVEYLPEQGDNKFIAFNIALDTHSVNLDAFDFQKDIVLDSKDRSINPTLVNQSGSGHHRSAEVTFVSTSVPFTIVVKNVSNIERREFEFKNLSR